MDTADAPATDTPRPPTSTPTTSTPTKLPCPGCDRDIRVTDTPDGPAFWRHWVDPQAPRGGRDRCVNSRRLVAQAYVPDADGTYRRVSP